MFQLGQDLLLEPPHLAMNLFALSMTDGKKLGVVNGDEEVIDSIKEVVINWWHGSRRERYNREHSFHEFTLQVSMKNDHAHPCKLQPIVNLFPTVCFS